MSPSPVAALWRLRPYLRPYRYQLVLMLFAAILSTGTEIVIPLIAKVGGIGDTGPTEISRIEKCCTRGI